MPQMSSFDALRVGARHFFLGSDLRRGITLSVSLHALVGAAVFVSTLNMSFELPEKKEQQEERLIAFNVGPETESDEPANIPEIAPPAAVEEAVGPETDEPPAEVSFPKGGSGDDLMVWTPEPPRAQQRNDGSADAKGLVPVLDLVEIPAPGSEPTLVSYEIGQFDSEIARQEAERLNGEGVLRMLVQVDDEGIPAGCSVIDSSGSNVLDDFGCGLVMKYRYQPATDASGNPLAAAVEEVLEWSRGSRAGAPERRQDGPRERGAPLLTGPALETGNLEDGTQI